MIYLSNFHRREADISYVQQD